MISKDLRRTTPGDGTSLHFPAPNAKCKQSQPLKWTNTDYTSGVVAWDSCRNTNYMFRSYDCVAPRKETSNHLNPGPADAALIWQVALATVAAPTYFDPVELSGHLYLDGGISTNNPTREAIFDVTAFTGDRLTEGCVVSIGSGFSSKPTISPVVTKISKRGTGTLLTAADAILGETESTHRSVENLLSQSRVSYSRFTLPEVLDIGLDEWRRIPEVCAATNKYLCDRETMTKLDDCANILAQSTGACQSPNLYERFKHAGIQTMKEAIDSPLSLQDPMKEPVSATHQEPRSSAMPAMLKPRRTENEHEIIH